MMMIKEDLLVRKHKSLLTTDEDADEEPPSQHVKEVKIKRFNDKCPPLQGKKHSSQIS